MCMYIIYNFYVIPGYRGIFCSDSTYAASSGFQMLQTLFLTLSNLVFIGSIIMAVYRKWFSEAVIYTFVLLASSVSEYSRIFTAQLYHTRYLKTW